ncbi:hypothetical protein HYW55_01040 [Candidatus Gottesmanbacteria bacterium]|nr:hypothetical protein [Candidatus Gottesmanbacteria bacterium]
MRKIVFSQSVLYGGKFIQEDISMKIRVQNQLTLQPMSREFQDVIMENDATMIQAVTRAKAQGLTLPELKDREYFILRQTNHSIIRMPPTTRLKENDVVCVTDHHDEFVVTIVVQEHDKLLGHGHKKSVRVFKNTRIEALLWEAHTIMSHHFETWLRSSFMAPIGPGGRYSIVSPSIYVTKEMRHIIIIPEHVRVKRKGENNK